MMWGVECPALSVTEPCPASHRNEKCWRRSFMQILLTITIAILITEMNWIFTKHHSLLHCYKHDVSLCFLESRIIAASANVFCWLYPTINKVYLIWSYLILSHHITSHHISYHIISHLISSNLISSYLNVLCICIAFCIDGWVQVWNNLVFVNCIC